MAALISGRGNIVVITIPGQENLDDRLAGVADALKNFPSLKLSKILDDKGDFAERLRTKSLSCCRRKEKVDGINCLKPEESRRRSALHRLGILEVRYRSWRSTRSDTLD